MRTGAQQLIATAVEAELASYLAQFADLRTEAGHAAVVRNGHHPAATPDLWRDGYDRRRLIGILMLVFKNHPNRAGADLGRKPVCSVTFFP
ncbi:hypothetical protein OA238_c08830 [Octadecabacter arcticus 238]|uniref:Uncharacterized protein n=1 Tax=Octadecabacter arcticus 238 TaxID=391616 RepID=M9RFY6_9RHOB|nr:hypothetical protein OA238_c08830 [Octadecabacter arcticus 238]